MSSSRIGANSRSMNGLNNVSANSISTDLLVVENLQIDVAGTTPLVVPLTTSNSNIANTAFVQGAILTAGANYMDLTTNQTVATGVKTFTSLPESSAVPTTGDQLVNKTFTDGTYVDFVNNETIGGVKTFTSLPESSAVPTTGDQLVNKTFTDATYVDFVNNETIGGIKTFTSLPESSAVPTTGNQLVNKTFTDATYVDFVNNETIGGIKTFTSLPESSVVSTTGNQLTNKTYVDGAISAGSFVTTNTTQTITGAKTFTTNTVTASAGVTVKNGASSQTATLTQNSTTLDVIGVGDISIKPSNDFNVLTGTGKNINISCPSTALLPSTQTFNTGITNTSSYIALEAPTTYITGLSTQPNLIIAGASGTIYGLKFTRGGTTLSAINRINCSSTNDTFYLEVNSGTQITITNTAVTINPDDTFNMMPTATIISNVSSTVPSGFLYCNGQAVSRTVTYSRLFASIGTTYGVGDGSTTFNVPDFQGCFLRGAGNQTTGGVTYTAPAVGTIQQDAVLNPLYASNEGFRSAAAGARDCVSRDRITADPTDTNTGILPRFDRTDTENRPVNHAVYYYIRY